MAYLDNQRLFSLDEGDWSFTIERGWFPVITLPKRVTDSLIGFTESRVDADVVLPQVAAAVKVCVPAFRERWSGSGLLRPHLDFLLRALDRFEDGDFIACTSIVYPRIEGILRSMHEALGVEENASQRVLTQVATEAREEELHPYSWLLPAPFRRFIDEADFAHFTPGQPANLSRNTVGHGVATAQQFDEKGACLGLLVADQLFFYLPTSEANRLVETPKRHEDWDAFRCPSPVRVEGSSPAGVVLEPAGYVLRLQLSQGDTHGEVF